ncbi:MAG TPA: hypothetical protein VF807_16130 [Ktedonobacterales bacterium]
MSSDEPRSQPHAMDDAELAKEAVRCPFCQSADVELMSIFGSQLSTDQYYCRACHTPFERLSRD